MLTDGGTVHVRPIRPDDAERLVAFHGRLSPESIYYRFFSPKPRLTEREVERFTTVDMVDRVALVALLGEDIIAVARFDRWPQRADAEVAFVVDDLHKGRGLSTLLLEHLVAIARSVGITTFTAEVLPDNRAMLAVFSKAGFELHRRLHEGVVDISFPIVETAAFVESVERREQRAESRSIARLLRPRSVAVVGATDRPGSVGRAVMRNLLAAGFDGPVHPVNPAAPHVASVPAHATVSAIPDDVHLAVIAVPAPEVMAVLADCAAKHVRSVVVLSTFPRRPPAGDDPVRDIVAYARRHGMRLVGPASLGVVSCTPASTMHASFAPLGVRPGNVAISLQSGPLGTALLDLVGRVGLGISAFVSLGDKGDVSANDLLNHWDEDASTDVVLLYTEGFGNPRKFGRIARRVSRRKPIVAVKSGRGADDVATDALYEQAGVIRVATVQQLVDVGRLLAGQPLPGGNRLAVVANASSPALLALDGFAAAGLVVPDLDPATAATIARTMPVDGEIGAAVDLTYRATAGQYAAAVSALLADDSVDGVLAIHAPPLAVVDGEVERALAELAVAATKPVLAVVLGRPDGLLVAGSGVPSFAFPEPAVDAFGRAARHARWRTLPAGEVPALAGVDLDQLAAVVAEAVVGGPITLAVDRAATLLATVGIAVAPGRIACSSADVRAAVEQLGGPVALKALGLARLARGEGGGVALDLQDPDEAVASYERMREALGPATDRVLVQHMVTPGVETIVRVDADPAFGPVLSFGLGGAFADDIADRAACSLPVTDAVAERLVAASRAASALHALGSDLASVHDLLLRVGLLADAVPELVGLRLNPVLASPTGAIVVDATISLQPVSVSPDEPMRRLG